MIKKKLKYFVLIKLLTYVTLGARVAQCVRSLDLTTHTIISPILRGCTQLAAASDKVYQLLAHGWWFSPDSSTTKTGRHDTDEILLKVALNTKNQMKSYVTLADFDYPL